MHPEEAKLSHRQQLSSDSTSPRVQDVRVPYSTALQPWHIRYPARQTVNFGTWTQLRQDLPCDVDEASSHGAFFAILVALDGHAVQVPGLMGHPACSIKVLAHHDLAKDLHASTFSEVEQTMQSHTEMAQGGVLGARL